MCLLRLFREFVRDPVLGLAGCLRQVLRSGHESRAETRGENQGGCAPGLEGDVFSDLVEDFDGGGGKHGVLRVGWVWKRETACFRVGDRRLLVCCRMPAIIL